MQNIIRLITFTAFSTCAFAFLAGCTTSRHEALQRRQEGVDARHEARTERRELRSDHADARFNNF